MASLLGTGRVGQCTNVVWEMQYPEAQINMAFPLEKENLRTLSSSETHACVGEPVIRVTQPDKDQVRADCKKIIVEL